MSGDVSGERCIAVLAAMAFARRNWHTLSATERELVGLLEEHGYIARKKRHDGFVGEPVHRDVPIPEQSPA